MSNKQISIEEARFSETEVIEKKLLPTESRITLFRWRKKGLLGFLRIGSKVYYTRTHIETFLGRCERPAKAA